MKPDWMNGRRTYRSLAIAGAAIFIVATLIMMSASGPFLNSKASSHAALALGGLCQSKLAATSKTHFNYTTPPDAIEPGSYLQCSIGSPDEAYFVYAGSPLTQQDFDSSMIQDKAIVVHVVSDAGFGSLDPAISYNNTFLKVKNQRPELQPSLFVVNGHPAWGTQGGTNAGKIIVQNQNGTVLQTMTEPAPSTFYFTTDNKNGYSVSGYVPLSELVDIAKAIK